LPWCSISSTFADSWAIRTPADPAGRLPIWVLVAGVCFLLFVVTVVAWSLARPRPAGRPPTALVPGAEPPKLRDRTITIDARSDARWVPLDLSTGGEVAAADERAWDLAFRRFQVIVNGGPGFAGEAGVLALPGVSFSEVHEAPLTGYGASQVSAGGDTTTVLLEDWYDYSFFSHLLTPTPTVFVLRTADGRYAKFEFLDYYCPGADPGCVTVRYAYQGDGSRRLTP